MKLLALMGNTVLRSIVSDIQSNSWFSIIADEATDILEMNKCHCLSDGLMTTIKSMRSVLVWFNCLILIFGLLKDVLI